MILECFEYNQHFVAMMNIINHAKLCNLEGKFEKHHIIPRCFYKKKGLEVDNSSSNLVNLTLEEHRKVHQLAALCAKEFMKTSLDYARRIMNRESMCGIKPSEEHKRKISESLKGKPRSAETKMKISKSLTGKKSTFYGKHHSEETKKKLSESHTGEKNPNYGKTGYWAGKTLSDEVKKKMSVAAKAREARRR